MHECKISDLIRNDDINIVPHETTLRQAAEQLLLSDCELLVVTGESGRLVGVVSESGVVRSLLSPTSNVKNLATVVSRHVESVRSDLTLNHVLHLFRSSCHSAIPVIDADDRVCGLLRRRDVMQYLLSGRIDQAHARTEDQSSESTGDHGQQTNPETSVKQTSSQPNESGNVTSRPHFLRGEAARQRLKQSDDDMTIN
jgi:CBS domain-containing protein